MTTRLLTKQRSTTLSPQSQVTGAGFLSQLWPQPRPPPPVFAVALAMSATVLPTPVPETCVRRTDVIDVDLLEDDEVQFVSSSTRHHRSRSSDIIDVDSLPEGIAGPSSAYFFTSGFRFHFLTQYICLDLSRYRSPPLRQRSRPSPIPPVPPLSPRFRRHRSTFRPPPHQIPTVPSGVVLANPQPFAFEERLLGRQRHHTPANADGPEPPAPSHHPAIGLGGAIMATNNELQGSHRPHRHSRRSSRAVRLFSNSFFGPIYGLPEDSLDYLFDDGADAGIPALPDFYSPLFTAYNRLGRFSESIPSVPKNAPEYKRTFTHPLKVAPGFTHDLASSGDVEDLTAAGASSGPSSPTVDTVLVCAKCLDPLVMGNVPDDKRLWGLRCGHILDGKCVRELMRPADAQEDDARPSTETDGKGNGKAVGEPEQRGDAPPEGGGFLMRRLRSGRVVSPTTSTSRSKGKQKQKAQEPKVERVHEWSCPVSGCGRTHKTNLISGTWKTDESEGAILMYV